MTYAQKLNRDCACTTIDQKELQRLLPAVTKDRPHLFSSTTVFISKKNFTEMENIISAIEEVIKIPGYQKMALERAPSIAHQDFGPHGVFMGLDFHLTDEGPKLIEINTNAGGALLNLELACAQKTSCKDLNMSIEVPPEWPHKLEDEFVNMFLREWTLQGRSDKPNLIAIVDENPSDQFLFPEFVLFEKLFKKHGLDTIIADPKEISLHEGSLWYDGRKVDMIYNRLTDFYLENHRDIYTAYNSGSVVLTPSPHHHALYANKFNLETLTSESKLKGLGLSPGKIEILLKGIPLTRMVKKGESTLLWEQRKHLFFKPASGYGSKATYRGDKITRKVFEEVLEGDYVAQTLAPPSLRAIKIDESNSNYKLDIRAYVYEGRTQLLAARLYSGQTTNFRTPGGGFAPVFVISDPAVIKFSKQS